MNKLDTTCEQACMVNSKEKYYKKICKTLTDYNYLKNTTLSNAKIQEAIRKFMEEDSIADVSNVTADTFIHVSNTKINNANAIFTSKNIDKSDELVDAIKDLTINDAEYYESNTETANDAQGDLTCNQETVTHTRNVKFEQKLLSYRTIPVLTSLMKPGIDQMIEPIILVPQKILTLALK